MEFVTVVNRTKDDLVGTWDGRQYDIKPGKNHFPKVQAYKFKDQNPVMGSEDPRTGSMIYKIGIEESNDPCDPLPDALISASKKAVERWDRSLLIGARPTDIVPGDNGVYSVRDVKVNLPVDGASNFSKP